MKKITIEDILDPISPKTFFNEYWGKKHLIIRRNKFRDLYTWKDFNKHMNLYPDIKGLQILNYRLDGDGRWCLDKIRKGKLKLPMLSKKRIHELWKGGKSIGLPFSENQKEELVDICNELERYFGYGQVNIYASPREGSKSFPAHVDSTENFLFHQEGKQKWIIYKEFAPNKAKEVLEEFVLEAGDLLYIPSWQYHKVDTLCSRLMLSIHFKNKQGQSLDNFKISSIKESGRSQWLDWNPEDIKKKEKIKIREYRMKSDTWKNKYFRDKI